MKQVEPDLVLDEICMGAGECLRAIPLSLPIEPLSHDLGRKAGATFVDRRFLNIIRRMIGPRDFRSLTHENLESSIGSHTAYGPDLSDIMRQWELAKENFAGEDRYERFIRLPRSLAHLNVPDRGVTNGELRITG